MRTIKFTLLLLSLITTVYGQNSLIIKNLDAAPGDNPKIIIGLNNTENVSGVQFKIKVPNGLIVKEKEAKFVGRNSDHVIYPKALGNGEYMILCFSGSNANFTGQTGDLIEIPVEVPLSYIPGETYNMLFTEALVSSSAGGDIGSNHQNGVLTIIEGKNPDLKVGGITIQQNDIIPNALCNISWTVENIGLSAAIGGWREQVSLISQTNGKKYIIGYSNYNNNVSESLTITRDLEVVIPSIIGFDGAVKVEVVLTTNSQVKEPTNAKENNTALSIDSKNLLKRLIFTVSKNEIFENSRDSLRLNLVRSGDTNIEEEFTVSTVTSNAFNLPATIKISQNKSSNFLYVKPINNTTYEGDRVVTAVAQGNAYSDESVTFNLRDDEKVVLSLTYPLAYNSTIGSKIPFTLNANFSVNNDRTILLSTDQSKRLGLPSQVILAAGSQSVMFEGTILDTQVIDKVVVANVYAKADGYTTAIKDIKLSAINIPDFSLSINPNKISEGDGIKASYATLKRTNQLDKAATVKISASLKNQLILPSEILFQTGQSEKTFNIGAIDNAQVEGERIITVTSQIKFESCACVDNTDLTTVVKQDITLLDNDGLTLIATIAPSTIKAGAINNKLTISRNTDNPTILSNPVVVNLSSDFPSIVILPNTVIIPADSKEMVFSFITVIDPTITGDQSIRIQAESPGYSTGFGWILVSDQNLPDVLISKVETVLNNEAGKKITVQTSLQNQGNSSYPTGSKIDYYLSNNNSIGNLKPIVSSIINKGMAIGETIQQTDEIQLPNLSGDFYLIVVINGDKSISELTFDNNQNQVLIKVLPSYTITVTVDKNIYKTGEIVKVSGQAKTAIGNPVADASVALKIKNAEFERNYNLKTDANGSFTFDYKPIENETGTYTVGAAFPGEVIVPQIGFQLLGFEILNKPQYVKWETLAGIPLGKEFTLKNKTNTKLTGVKIILPIDADFTINQTPIDIEAGATVSLPFNIVSTIASLESKYYEFKIAIQSNEGAQYNELVYYFCKNQEAKLIANPISINTTMVKDQTRLYEFTLKNIGAVDAENIEVLLPELGWLKLSSTKIIERIKPNEEVKVVLEFQPTVKEQVNVPITGNFIVRQKAGVWISIPFRIETVSVSTGKLVIDATDEYTYNTASAPHLKGAKVIVKHPFTGAIIAEGITNDFGLFEVPDINEGWYVVNVSANKHNPYQNNILVDPGKDTKVNAFLPYQAVTYSWDVKPTEILDEYDIKLDVQFETNVPAPVIVMDIDNPKLDLQIGESRMSYITITNYGLIAATKISIDAGEADGYTIKPIINSLDVLNAKASVVIPVLIKNVSSTNKMVSTGKLSSTSSISGCTAPVNFRATYLCDTEKEIFAFSAYVKTNCGGGSSGPSKPGEGIIVYYTPSPVSGGPTGSFDPCAYVYCGNLGYGSSTLTRLPNICDPCDREIIKTLFVCTGFGKYACVFDIITATDLFSVGKGALGCFDPPKCTESVVSVIEECLLPDFGLSGKTNLTGKNNAAPKGKWDFIVEDFKKINAADTAQKNKMSEYFQNPALESNYADLILFANQIASNLDGEKAFTTTDIVSIKANMNGSSVTAAYIDGFTTRWNTTIEAWSNNILSPNGQYPNIVDKVKINEYNAIKNGLKLHAFTRGFVSVNDMHTSDLNAIEEYQKEKSEQAASVCASVTIEFPQKLTMTRQAFEGTLKINNSSDKAINDINLDLVVTDENGENKTHLFQINKDVFLSGTGSVGPSSNGSGLAIFIPTKEAAPEVKKSYSFGGTLSYFDPDINERVSVTLNPVTLEVNPSPDLILHYFMQRDILGDDALTLDVIEPSIPAELSLMITNDGFGLAKKVNVESMQPKIKDNEKGLLINFNMIGSNFNNEPKQLGLLNVDFGDIEPKSSAVGQWFFTSSLIGHFIKYDVKVNHTSSYGNANLSLIKAAYIHELVKSVKSYGTNSDNIADFLVNDVADVYDTPDMIYLSDGTSANVSNAEAIEITVPVSTSTLTAKLKLSPITTGWNYSNILDPSLKNYILTKVIRDSDGFEIPTLNFWQTNVTLKDGLNPKYETKLHVLDKISGIETYTLYFKPLDGDIPKVVTFVNPPEQYNTTPVNFITVEFNKEIDFNTFTNADIEIIRQGVTLPTDNILIGKINATTFSINIEAFTAQSGFYGLTVKTLGIKDLVGNDGRDGKKIEWLQFINELGILKFESDQLKKNPINSINLVFNKPIRTEEFTQDKITINGQPVSGLTIQKIDDYNYTISGINPLNEANGTYTIAIDVINIKAADGVSGLAVQTFTWMVDNILPTVVSIQKASQGTNNTQIITELEIELNRKLSSNLEASAFKFTKNGQDVSIPIIIQKKDDLHYTIYGLGEHTADNGTYRVTINQSSFRDENDNSGEGLAETSWTVRLDALIAISNVKLTPDRGISSTDNITSGNDIQLIYETLIDNITVEVYELLGTSEVLIDKQLRGPSAAYSVPIINRVGAKKFKVVAYDANQNRSNPKILSAYIDFTDIITVIQPVDEISNDCTDFNYINVNFSDDINESTFTLDAITLKSSGVVIPKNNVVIQKVTDKNYTIGNIQSTVDGAIILEIDKTKISKKLSGQNGLKTEIKNIGSSSEYAVTFTGEENPEIYKIYEYSANTNMNKYDWIIINGEIISTEANKVTVKWNKLNSQSLILRYQTPLNCTLTATREVLVQGIPLGIEEELADKGKSFISPVPNNGKFSIHTSVILNDCTLSVFDFAGKLIHQENHINLSKQKKDIDLNLNSGVYLLILNNHEEKIHFRFIVK